MKFNTKTRYGLRTMIELALANSEKGILQKHIARNQDISEKYLDHIISALKVSGLIKNVKGKKSGYKLVMDSREISVHDIFNAFEPDFAALECVIDRESCGRNNICSARFFWLNMRNTIIDYLKSVTLDELAQKEIYLRKNNSSANMYHI